MMRSSWQHSQKVYLYIYKPVAVSSLEHLLVQILAGLKRDGFSTDYPLVSELERIEVADEGSILSLNRQQATPWSGFLLTADTSLCFREIKPVETHAKMLRYLWQALSNCIAPEADCAMSLDLQDSLLALDTFLRLVSGCLVKGLNRTLVYVFC
jgi:hypothetical protein